MKRLFRLLFFMLILSLFFFFLVSSWGGDGDGDGDKKWEQFLSLRDPFKAPESYFEKKIEFSPLETYAAGEFVLKGVITGLDKKKAILLSPDGKIYIVSEKMKLGTHQGVIEKILPEKMIISEESEKNALGEKKRVHTEIKMKKSVDSRFSLGPSQDNHQKAGMVNALVPADSPVRGKLIESQLPQDLSQKVPESMR